MKKDRLIHILKENWLLIVGGTLAILFVYSSFFLGNYQVSFTNVMYQMSPWNSLGVDTQGPLLSDVMDSFLPSLYSSITNGTFFGFWDAQAALGAPSDVSSWLYPLNYWFLLPLSAATFLRTVSEFLIAFIGMYLLMRAFGCQKGAAVASGVTYCFSSVIVMWLGWQHSDVAAFAPFAFFFFEKFLNTLQIKYCFGIVASVFLMLVAGMPTYAGYFLYLMAIYVFCRTIWLYHKEKKTIFIIFSATLLSVILAALCSLPYTMDLLSSVGGNGYMDSRSGQASAILSWNYLHSLFFPYVRFDQNTIHLNESTIYVGLAAIILLSFTAFNFRKKNRMIFWCSALVVVFLLIFTHTLDFVFTRLPAINTSPKFRVITLFNFVAVVLMGLNLNDIIVNRGDYLKHKIRTLLTLCIGVFVLAGVFLFTYYYQGNKGYRDYFWNYLIVSALLTFFIGAFMIKKIPTQVIIGGICLVIIFDMGSFAKIYLPMVEKGYDDIPIATDTIEFLQNNTTDERFGATGKWTLFPNTNVFYDLNDVRGHNFVFTNSDMKNYYTRISEENADSPTRYTLSGELNENLLKYLGTKYLVEGLVFSGEHSIPGPLVEECIVSQEYIFEEDNPTAIVILPGTYGNQYSEEKTICLSISETETGEVIYQADYSLSKARDNSSYIMALEDNQLKKGVSYTISFRTNTTETQPIALWMEHKDANSYQAYYNNEPVDTVLSMKVFYGTDNYIGSDELYTRRLDEYSDRVELADTVKILSDSEAILNEMSEKFEKNTAFLEKSQTQGLIVDGIGPLTETDTAEIINRSDDNVIVSVNTETPKLLMLNEYYDSDWKVYVNGEEQQLYKSNYLFRSVKVPAGESIVEFRYEPCQLYIMFYIAGAGVLAYLLLIVFRKRIQNRIDKKKIR